MKTGIELIAKERTEQIQKHNRTIEKDIKENPAGELRLGAIAVLRGEYIECPMDWDREICLKMCEKPYMERLIIAGALISAEIDRINNI